MTAFELYLLLKLDSIQTLSIVLSIGFGGSAVMLTLFGIDGGGSLCFKRAKLFVAGCTIATLTATLLPSTKEMAAIYVVPRIVNNEQVQAIGENGLKILEAYTKELLEDIAPVVKEEKK